MPEEAINPTTQPEVKKSNKIFIGISIEILFLLCIGIIILIVLLYFKVIPNNIFGSQKPTPTPTTSQKLSKTRIIATSKNSDYKLTLTNEKALADIFKEWGVYEREYNNEYGKSNGPIDTVEISLENKSVQPGVDKDTPFLLNMPISSQYKIENNKIILPFYFPPVQITNSPNLANNMLHYVLKSAYGITHSINTPEEIKRAETDINKALIILEYSKTPYFIFEKTKES